MTSAVQKQPLSSFDENTVPSGGGDADRINY